MAEIKGLGQQGPLERIEKAPKDDKSSAGGFRAALDGAMTGPNAAALDALTKAPAPKTAMGPEGIKFSNHAVERMMSRGIKFTNEDLGKLNEAVSKASAKGSKDSLILMNDSALIVSVKNKTVVTVMDKAALKENVFTNIDSTIVM